MPQTARCARAGTPRHGIQARHGPGPVSADRRGDRVRSARRTERTGTLRAAPRWPRRTLQPGPRTDESQRQQRERRHHQRAPIRDVAAHAADRPRPAPRSNAHREGPVDCGARPLEATSGRMRAPRSFLRKTNQKARGRHVQLEQRRPDRTHPPGLQSIDDGARITDGPDHAASPPASASTAASDASIQRRSRPV